MKLGRLQLGSRPWHHGLLGASSLVFTFAALVTMRDGFLLLSMACTTPLALGSLALLAQAPQFTAIARGIVAPHREAYKRTISVVLYLNVRLARSAGWWPFGTRAYGAACAAWALWLLPRSAFDNGNTLVFVVPIFAGSSVMESDELMGRTSLLSRLPQYLMTAMLEAHDAVATFTPVFAFLLAGSAIARPATAAELHEAGSLYILPVR